MPKKMKPAAAARSSSRRKKERDPERFGPCGCCVALSQVRPPYHTHDEPCGHKGDGAATESAAAAGATEKPQSMAGKLADFIFGRVGGTGKKPVVGKGARKGAAANGAVNMAPPGTEAGGAHGGSAGGGAGDGDGGNGNGGGGKPPVDDPNAAATGDASGGAHTEDWIEELAIPKPKRIWSGANGLLFTVFGIIAPALMIFSTCASMPKRITLVMLNHPLETAVELLLVLAIPLANLFAWSQLCKNNVKFPRSASFLLGSGIASCLTIAAICTTALFVGTEQLSSEIGTDFSAGFAWIALLSGLTGLISFLLAWKVRSSREFAASRRQVVFYGIIGAVLGLVAVVGGETRPWSIRYAERLAVSNNRDEAKQGLAMLRQLDPEKELRMECSDSRAAGLSGLFMPLKSSTQHQLYFALTGKPYSFREFNNSDLSSMPDDYVSRHVVGDRVPGLSLTRSTMTGTVHPRTLTSSVEWTFVFKNQSSDAQEARAELALPPGAVVNGLTVWRQGEPSDAHFVASSKPDQQVEGWQEAGHDCPAIITHIGRDRFLMHCYPVGREEELKVRVAAVIPLIPDATTSASLLMPRFLATNFDLSGEHQIRLRSEQMLACGLKGVSTEKAPDGQSILSGTLDQADLESSKMVITAARAPVVQPVMVYDKIATQNAAAAAKAKWLAEKHRLEQEAQADDDGHADQVVIMVDGASSKTQVEAIKAAIGKKHRRGAKPVAVKTVPKHYVIENVTQVGALAPKHLVVVLDSSMTLKQYAGDLRNALQKLPHGIPAKLIVASSEDESLLKAVPLSEGLRRIEDGLFVGGQDNLKGVVKAAEIAGEVKGGAVLWIHGPQPELNQEIYIMAPYAAAPTFYEMALGSGETDTTEFFKNHSEIGPFIPVQRSTESAGADLATFFQKWTGGNRGYTCKLLDTDKKEKLKGAVEATKEEAREILTLRANQRVSALMDLRRNKRASLVAMQYQFVSPVSVAMVGGTGGDNPNGDESGTNGTTETTAEEGNANADAFATSGDGSAPELQGATNGTIGPQGDDATVIMGVNTAGTVRVNNLANLEALLNIIANLGEIVGMLAGALLVLHGFARAENLVFELLGHEIVIGPGKRMTLGALLIIGGLAVPGTINWFVASARDANLFS